MSEVGDLDEAGKFCIEGRDIVNEGPRSREDLNDIIRDAIVRGGGDVWKVPDFMASYTDTNIRKRMYNRIEAPMDGFLKIVPTTGCFFHNYEFYSGVEVGMNYKFENNNKLEPYEEEVSTALNKILRHQVGKASERQSLVCDDAGWVPIDDVLKCEGIWRNDRTRRPHTFLAPRGRGDDKYLWNKEEATYRLKTLFRIMFHCARYGRRVREQILACGIYPDIDRSSGTCTSNNVSVETEIPEEGLLLYPVAVRSPTGHKDGGINDVVLRPTLLSHSIAPTTVISLPACFHITTSDHLKSIWKVDPWRFEWKFKDFHILQSIRSLGPASMEHYQECGYSQRSIHLPLHPHRNLDDGVWRSTDRPRTGGDGQDHSFLQDSRRLDPICQQAMATVNRTIMR